MAPKFNHHFPKTPQAFSKSGLSSKERLETSRATRWLVCRSVRTVRTRASCALSKLRPWRLQDRPYLVRAVVLSCLLLVSMSCDNLWPKHTMGRTERQFQPVLAYICVMEKLSVSSGVSPGLTFSQTPRDTLMRVQMTMQSKIYAAKGEHKTKQSGASNRWTSPRKC